MPSAAISAELSPRIFAYGRYQQSFRPGGLNLSGEDFKRDKVEAVETGLRYASAGVRSLEAGLSLAYARWSDVQADIPDSLVQPTTANIGDARIWTLDLSFSWRPAHGLTLDAAAGFNNAKLLNAGDRSDLRLAQYMSTELPNVARLSARVSGEYRFKGPRDVDMRISGSGRYAGKSRRGIGGSLQESQGGWLEANASVPADVGPSEFLISMSNVFNSSGNRFALFTQEPQITPLRPRTIRIAWTIDF